MIILVTGANGFLGRHIANTLKRAGHQVRELNRANGGDFERLRTPQAWLPHLDGVEAVVNCVGIIAETSSQRFSVVHGEAPIALFRACVAGGVRRVVQISALGT
ncbi:MAG: NAD-dependent epimerase/dehydratase family protein, partial [Sulfuricella sp.]|nr:NAD-dependent epimerase/dehydratase family protein [Sulfuricella sp.]